MHEGHRRNRLSVHHHLVVKVNSSDGQIIAHDGNLYEDTERGLAEVRIAANQINTKAAANIGAGYVPTVRPGFVAEGDTYLKPFSFGGKDARRLVVHRHDGDIEVDDGARNAADEYDPTIDPPKERKKPIKTWW